MAPRTKARSRETLLNTVARKLGTAAGTVTRVTKELSQDFLRAPKAPEVTSGKREAPAGKSAIKKEANREKPAARPSRNSRTMSSSGKSKQAISKRRAHRDARRKSTKVSGQLRKTRVS